MDINEAMEEVWKVAKGPRQVPPDATAVEEVGGVELMELFEKDAPRARIARDSLTLAQETVCRWVWGRMARHLKPFEPFEAGFLYDYNVDHELTLWVRMTFVFEEFLKLHPSANKRETVEALCQLSCGFPPVSLKPKRAKELADLWRGKAMDLSDDEFEKE
jgi:hypothetical protein